MNQELREMFVADQTERKHHPAAERYTQKNPQSGIDKDKVPEWLKEALERWEREDA